MKWHKTPWLIPRSLIFYIRSWEIHQLKIICTRQNKDKTYDEVGMNNRYLTSKYTTTNGFLRHGIRTDYFGNNIRLEVWFGDNIYREPDKVLYVTVWGVAQGGLRSPQIPDNLHSFLRNSMIFITSTNHGCVYTLSQEDGDELYYAPIYANGNINMEEFAPVDMDSVDMDDMEIFDIRNRLKAMSEVWHLTNWHKGVDKDPNPS